MDVVVMGMRYLALGLIIFLTGCGYSIRPTADGARTDPAKPPIFDATMAEATEAARVACIDFGARTVSIDKDTHILRADCDAAHIAIRLSPADKIDRWIAVDVTVASQGKPWDEQRRAVDAILRDMYAKIYDN